MFIDPELTKVLAALPGRPADPYADIQATRAGFRTLMAPMTAAAGRGCAVEPAVVPGPDGNSIAIQVLRPSGAAGPLPAVLYIHGGGFAYGELDGPSPMALEVCRRAGALVVNVHYRLAPEHPFPAGAEDCYAALGWLAGHAADLGIDAERIAVAGASAGGCLSAALALMARDRGGPHVAFQCLLIPCLDDRAESASARRITDPRFTNGPAIRRIWDIYLGSGRGENISPYAAPARATDLSGLPPAYLLTCGLDSLRDEGLDYARLLARATTAHWLAALTSALHPHTRRRRRAGRPT